jgi:hypothetical protein
MSEKFKIEQHSEIKENDLIISKFNMNISQQEKIILEGSGSNQERNDLSQNELGVLVAMKSLPSDPLERMVLLEEFKKKPDGRFGDSALVALEALTRDGKNARIKLKKDWRNCLTYPEYVSKWTAEKLDELAVLIDMPQIKDRYARMGSFLEVAKDKGLLSEEDFRKIRSIIAKEL